MEAYFKHLGIKLILCQSCDPTSATAADIYGIGRELYIMSKPLLQVLNEQVTLQPNEKVWTFLDDRGEISDSYTYKVRIIKLAEEIAHNFTLTIYGHNCLLTSPSRSWTELHHHWLLFSLTHANLKQGIVLYSSSSLD